MQQAGANASARNLVAMAADPQKFMREAMQDPDGQNAQMYDQVVTTAAKLVAGNDQIEMKDAVSLVLQQMGASPQEAKVHMANMENYPKMVKERTRERSRLVDQKIRSTAGENLDIVARAERGAKGLMQEYVGDPVSELTAGAQDRVTNVIADVGDNIQGLAVVGSKLKDINKRTVKAALSSASFAPSAERLSVMKAKPSDAQKNKAGSIVNRALAGNDMKSEIESMKNDRDPLRRSAKAREIINKITGGAYDKGTPTEKAAFEEAFRNSGNGDISTYLSETPMQQFGEKEMEDLKEDQDDLKGLLGQGSTAMSSAAKGAAAGGGVGAALGSALGPAGAAVGSLMGGIAGGVMGAVMGLGAEMSDAELANITSSDDAEEIMNLIASGGDEGRLNELIGGKDADPANAKLANIFSEAKKKGTLGDLQKKFKAVRSKEERRSVAFAASGAGTDIAKSLKKAGVGGNIAGSIEGGNLQTIIEGIGALSPEDVAKLEGKGGAAAKRAFGALKATSEEDLIAAVGAEAAKELMGGEAFSTENAARYASQAMLGDYAGEGPQTASGGDSLDIIAGKGETVDQRRQRQEMIAVVGTNAAAMDRLEKALVKVEKKLP
jgi:hypothetical protein